MSIAPFSTSNTRVLANMYDNMSKTSVTVSTHQQQQQRMNLHGASSTDDDCMVGASPAAPNDCDDCDLQDVAIHAEDSPQQDSCVENADDETSYAAFANTYVTHHQNYLKTKQQQRSGPCKLLAAVACLLVLLTMTTVGLVCYMRGGNSTSPSSSTATTTSTNQTAGNLITNSSTLSSSLIAAQQSLEKATLAPTVPAVSLDLNKPANSHTKVNHTRRVRTVKPSHAPSSRNTKMNRKRPTVKPSSMSTSRNKRQPPKRQPKQPPTLVVSPPLKPNALQLDALSTDTIVLTTKNHSTTAPSVYPTMTPSALPSHAPSHAPTRAASLVKPTSKTTTVVPTGSSKSLEALLLLSGLFQPRVTIVDNVAHKAYNSLSNSNGTVWCDGRPTYWIVSPEALDTPWCRTLDASWVRAASRNQRNSTTSQISNNFNAATSIDRRTCVSMDINKDSVPDIVCFVSAHAGGHGYHEVYFTNTNDGSLRRIQTETGLNDKLYISMRARMSTTVKGPNQQDLVFVAVKGIAHDKIIASNVHRMFKIKWRGNATKKFFKEVPGPWQTHFDPSCAVTADITNNGVSDLIVCDKHGVSHFYAQERGGKWNEVDLGLPAPEIWRNVRVGDVTGDGRQDLVVVLDGEYGGFKVYQGIEGRPWFNFTLPLYQKRFSWATPDLEIVDANADGFADIYVVQVDEFKSKESYCSLHTPNNGTQHPVDWIPPLDIANDVLLLGVGLGSFQPVTMKHSLPGCGSFVQNFDGQQSLVLAQGDWGHAGYSLLLEW